MTTAGDVVYCAISMTTDKSVDFQVCLYDAETDITTWNIADTNHVTSQQTWDIYCITSNGQLQFETDFCIHVSEACVPGPGNGRSIYLARHKT